MPTYRLITDQQIETDCADLLPAYEQYLRDFRQSVACPSGFTVLPRITMQPGESLSALRDRILAQGQCDYNDLMGDSIPFPVLHEFPFGHVPDAVPGDGIYFAPGPMTVDSGNIVTSKPEADPFGAFGRIGPFNVESTDTRISAQKYRDWLTDQMNPLPFLYAPEVAVDDHFAFPPYADIGAGASAQIPAGWTVHEMTGLTETGDNNDFQDGEWAIIAARPVMCNINLDGGFWNRLYNTGSSKEWRAANPGAYLEVIFGSEQDEWWSDDNLMVTAISTPYCNCCYIDWWGQEQLHLFFAGQPVGAVQRAAGYYAKKMYGTIQGSCAHMLLDPQLALVQAQNDINDLKAWKTSVQPKIDAVLAGTGGGGTTDTGTAITILSAKYRQVANTTTFKDCTAVVQALVAAGKPFFVYSDASVNGNGPCLSDPSWGVNPKDPYPQILKELVVTYSKGGGAAQTVVFGQFAAVTF